jgi:hypothetical protein
MAAHADIVAPDGLLFSGSDVPTTASAPVVANGSSVRVLPNLSTNGLRLSELGATGTGSSTGVAPDANAPVTAHDNWLSLFGRHYSTGTTNGGVVSNDASAVGDHQVNGDANTPVSVTCNNVAVLGSGADGCRSKSSSSGIHVPIVTTDSNGYAIGDSSADPSASAPTSAGCNSVSVLGDASGCAEPTDTSTDGSTAPADPAGTTDPNGTTGPTGSAATDGTVSSDGANGKATSGNASCATSVAASTPTATDPASAGAAGGLGALGAIASMGLLGLVRKVRANA